MDANDFYLNKASNGIIKEHESLIQSLRATIERDSDSPDWQELFEEVKP